MWSSYPRPLTLFACFGPLILGACSGPGPRRPRTAPRSAAEVGIVVEPARAADVAAFLRHEPRAGVRRIYGDVVELFDVDAATVGRAFPTARTYANVFVPRDLRVADLPPCTNGDGPVPRIVTDAGPQLERPFVATADPAARAAWVLFTPDGARREVAGPTLTFTPDRLGAYRMILVGRDALGACGATERAFVVSANPPLGPILRPPTVPLDRFPHLLAIDAPHAWTVTRGAGVIVAVVDTGVDYTHPALRAAIDRLGHDFVDDDDLPFDDDGHGTHVAALAVGRPFGVANAATLLPIKALTSLGGDVASIAAGIVYAVDHGAHVINVSAGASLPFEHPALARAMAYAGTHDALVVTAAGNGDPATGLGLDLDRTPLYPAAGHHPNQLTVAASHVNEALATYSNFGRSTIDVTAPGGLMPDDPIWSAGLTYPAGEPWAARAGTSMATPLVSGTAALVRAARPTSSAGDVAVVVSTSGPFDPELARVTKTGRRLDAAAAVTAR